MTNFKTKGWICMSEISKNTLNDFFGLQTIKKIDYESKLNKEQYKAVKTTEGPVLIIAGAGSGKTTVLTYRLAYLIEHGVAPERILLLTFTNKAANEMISRALNMLGADMKINGSTYHSFCAKILRIHHEAAGLDANFLIKDAGESADILNYVKELEGMNKEKEFPNGYQLSAIFSMSVNKQMTLEEVVSVMYDGRFESYLEEIKQLQEAYKNYKAEHNFLDYDDLLVLSNKMLRENDDVRRRISDSYEYIMVDEYQDSNILQFELISLLRSFENRNICVVGDDQQCVVEGTKIRTKNGLLPVEVINERDEIAVACGESKTIYVHPKEVMKKTYDGYVYEIRTKYGRTITVTGDHTMFADDRTSPPKENFANFYLFGGPMEKGMGCLHEMAVSDESLKKRLDDSCDGDINDSLLAIEKILQEEQYENVSKEKYAAITKGSEFKFLPAKSLKPGMILPVYKLPNGIISGDIIVSVKRKPYSGFVYDINVDYYMNYIANDICVHNCIYGFRGANHKNILNFPRQFDPCEMIVLFRNYRSNQEILDFTNKVAMEAKERFDKELLGTHESGYKPKIYYVADEQMQAQAVLYDIIKRHNSGTPLKDMAVLIRASKDSVFLEGMIARQMGRYPIQYKKFGGIKFLEQAHIRDILAFLKVLVNEKDEISWFRIFQLYTNIGPVYGRRLVEGINSDGIEYLLNKLHKGKKYGEWLPEIYNWYKELQELELSDQIEQIINVHYYNARNNTLKARKSKESVIRDERKKMDEQIESSIVLLEMCKSYKNANQFLNDLTLDANYMEEDADDFLTISTVHSAKGLEFDTVYVLKCTEGSFPWRCKTDEEYEEERRVFYVATTRAKENLQMYVPNYEMKWNNMEKVDISRFLKTTRNYCQEEFID